MKKLSLKNLKALRLAASASLALVALVSSANAQQPVTEIITLRSGNDINGAPLSASSFDGNISQVAVADCTPNPSNDYGNALGGSKAMTVSNTPLSWVPSIGDPDARWIHSNSNPYALSPAQGVQYAHLFELPSDMPHDATILLELEFAVDDIVRSVCFGDGSFQKQIPAVPTGGPSSVTNHSVSGTADSFGLSAGQNTLFFRVCNTDEGSSGLIYSVKLTVDYCRYVFDLRSGFGEIPEDPNVKVDVIFLADTTGSMTDEIADIQADIASIINDFDGLVQDIDVGVASYKDFNATLGSTSSYVYQLEQKIGDISTQAGKGLITFAVDSWQANGGGGDGPEAQLYALHRLATDPVADIGWRAGSVRMIVYIGDSPGHDPICTALTNGNSPITEASVIADLLDNGAWGGTKVIAVNVGGNFVMYPNGLNDAFDEGNYLNQCGASTGLAGQADRITNATGGSVQSVSDPTLVGDAVKTAFLTALNNGTQLTPGFIDGTVKCQSTSNPSAYNDMFISLDPAWVVSPHSTWLSHLSGPAAWIHSGHSTDPNVDGSGKPADSVLYGHPFDVPNFPLDATVFVDLEWAASDSLFGVSLNGDVTTLGGNLDIGGVIWDESNFSSKSHFSHYPATSFLDPGTTNELYLSQIKGAWYGGGISDEDEETGFFFDCAGIMYIAKVTISYQCEQEISYDTFCECHEVLAPCGNYGQPGQGCANSTGLGSSLTASGTSGNITLHADNLPLGQTIGLFFKGNNVIGPLPFGDGLRCVGGEVSRIGVVITNTGRADLHLQSNLPPGEPTAGYYQFWYRDSSGPCLTGFNLSSAISLP